jgi:hypothetical protein
MSNCFFSRTQATLQNGVSFVLLHIVVLRAVLFALWGGCWNADAGLCR